MNYLKDNSTKSHLRFSDNSDVSDATKECDDIDCTARSTALIAHLNSPDKAEKTNSGLLDPALIPSAVKTSLLELHDIVCMSKSDSNIKSKRQNNLLRPPVLAQKASALDKKSIFKSKKAFSLQLAGSDPKKITYRDKKAIAEESVLSDRIVADCHTNNSTLPFSMDSSVENLINNQ